MKNELIEAIDRINELQLEKKKLAAQVKELGKEIDTLNYNVLQSFDANDITGLKTEEAEAALDIKLFPNITDKNEFYEWAINNDHFEMLQSRLNKRPVLTFYDESGECVPGTDVATKRTIKVKELKK